MNSSRLSSRILPRPLVDRRDVPTHAHQQFGSLSLLLDGACSLHRRRRPWAVALALLLGS